MRILITVFFPRAEYQPNQTMKALLNHLKAIAYLFAILMLLQSCVIYQSTPYSLSEASQNNKGRIKINTTEGKKYIVSWVDEKDGNLVSVLKTKKTVISAEKVSYMKTVGSDPLYFAVDSIFTYTGEVEVIAQDDKGKFRNYNFIKISVQDSLIQGLEMTNSDTAMVILPIDQIESIKLQNKSASTVGSISISVLATLLVVSIAAASQFSYSGL